MEPIWDLFKAALGLSVDVTIEMITLYWEYLKKLAKWSIIVMLLFLPLLLIGSLMKISWMSGLYLAIIVLLITVWLIATFPIIMLIQSAYGKISSMKMTAKIIGGILFWLFLISLYFYLVPVWNYPAAIPLVFIIFAILALGFMRFGIGISPKIIIAEVLIIFVLMNISFYMPASRAAMGTFVKWLDRSVAEFITTPERRTQEEQKKQQEAKILEEQQRVQEREDFFDRYLLNRSFINESETQEVAVLVVDESNRISQELAQKIASLPAIKEFNVTPSFFTNQFISDRLFQKIFEGTASEVKKLDLSKYIDYMVFCKKTTNFNENLDMQNMITAHINIEIHIISTKTGMIEDIFTTSEVGAGFSKADAENMGKERILKKLIEKDWSILRKKET